jgi:hypothetical protein
MASRYLTYKQIATQLKVSKDSVNSWIIGRRKPKRILDYPKRIERLNDRIARYIITKKKPKRREKVGYRWMLTADKFKQIIEKYKIELANFPSIKLKWFNINKQWITIEKRFPPLGAKLYNAFNVWFIGLPYPKRYAVLVGRIDLSAEKVEWNGGEVKLNTFKRKYEWLIKNAFDMMTFFGYKPVKIIGLSGWVADVKEDNRSKLHKSGD